MNDDFKVLFELLEASTEEVAGHAAVTISPDVHEKLVRFAGGRCTDEEREEMKQLLQQQPDLIPILVDETVALRQAGE